MARGKCDSCRQLKTTLKSVRERVPFKATEYRPAVLRWCDSCRAKMRGHFKLAA